MRLPDSLSVPLRLIRVVDLPRWMLPIVIATTMLAFLFEGFGIYLLIPLLGTLAEGDGVANAMRGSGNVVLDQLFAIAEMFDGPYQTVQLLGLIIACIALRAVAILASQAAFVYAKYRFGHQLRIQLFSKFLRANENYLQAQQPGAMLNIMTTEIWRMSEGLRELAKVITHGSAIIVFFSLMLLMSPALMVIVAPGTLAIIAAAFLITQRARRLGNRALAQNTVLSSRIQEGLGGLRTIRLFGREQHEFDRFEASAERVRRAFFAMEFLNEVPQPLILLLFALFISALVLVTGPDQFVTLVVFLALMQRMQPHVTLFTTNRARVMNVGGPLDMVTSILKDESAAPLTSGALVAPRPVDALRLRDVVYRYPTAEAPALRGVTLEIPVGKTTALVGASGAGKSTILSLLCRQIDPDQGSVSVDGVPLPQLDLDSWRRRIAVVPQEVYLFDATLRDNIAYGRLDASDEEVEAAARIAGAMDFVDALPDGFDTRLGDRGSRLSGGQRQRIALARAVVREPDLLILDEATNALDNLSERMVRDAIQRVSAGRTVVVVAHRLANVLNADNVVVMEAGRIVEQGPPAELMRKGGAFAALAAAEKAPAA